MTQKGEVKPEYKTIRISASSYYKLVELTGIMNIVSGLNISMTTMSDLLIVATHNNWYPEYLKIINDPKKLETTRAKTKDDIKKIMDIVKNVKITL